MHAVSSTHRFYYQGWDIRVALQGRPDRGELSASAELFQASARRHRLALEGEHRLGSTALAALCAQVRAFIDRGGTKA